MSYGDYPHDICNCGDYRCHSMMRMDVAGYVTIGQAPWNCCSKFKFSHHSKDEDIKRWRQYNEAAPEPSKEPPAQN